MWLEVQCSESASFQAHYEFLRELERANGSQIFGNVPWGIIIISSHCVRISWAASQVKACKMKQAANANPQESQPTFDTVCGNARVVQFPHQHLTLERNWETSEDAKACMMGCALISRDL